MSLGSYLCDFTALPLIVRLGVREIIHILHVFIVTDAGAPYRDSFHALTNRASVTHARAFGGRPVALYSWRQQIIFVCNAVVVLDGSLWAGRRLGGFLRGLAKSVSSV
jgi:hypothetical protein